MNNAEKCVRDLGGLIMANLECKNCCYFDITGAPEWNGKEHCCFHEWGHSDEEVAPCDETDDEE